MHSRIISSSQKFDAGAFSDFKHGALAPARRFARGLMRALEQDVPDALWAPRLVMTASCYRYVPLASVTLARLLEPLVNQARFERGLASLTRTQIYRDQLVEGDYSALSLDQRRQFIDQDQIWVDGAVLAGATVVVVDDIRITGFHEAMIARLMEQEQVSDCIFAYHAVIDGRNDPVLERRLNTARVQGLTDLERLCAAGDVSLNSRVCKLILSTSADERVAWFSRASVELLRLFQVALECNGYAGMQQYQPAYRQLLMHLAQCDLQEVL